MQFEAEQMTAAGHTKKRILLPSTRYSLQTQSAPLVRGSSGRIMRLRFRSASIRVTNRRLSSTVVTCTAFKNKGPRSSLCEGAAPKAFLGKVKAQTLIGSSTSRSISERVLQAQLDLTHRNGSAADNAKVLVRVGGRLSHKCRAREDITVRRSPRRMIESVERFEAEL